MKVNTLNLYMGSIYNGKRVGDMTFDEVYRLAEATLEGFRNQ